MVKVLQEIQVVVEEAVSKYVEDGEVIFNLKRGHISRVFGTLPVFTNLTFEKSYTYLQRYIRVL